MKIWKSIQILRHGSKLANFASAQSANAAQRPALHATKSAEFVANGNATNVAVANHQTEESNAAFAKLVIAAPNNASNSFEDAMIVEK